MNVELVLDEVAGELGWLDPEPVFVGGAAVGLFLDAPGRSQMRPTVDVDCIAPQVIGRASRWELEKSLLTRG